MDVLFYHLVERSVEDVIATLVERSLERSWRVLLRFKDEQRCESVNNCLWTAFPTAFIPHLSDKDLKDKENFEEMMKQQPVFLTQLMQNVNNAQIGFSIAGAPYDENPCYERFIFLFEGYDREQKEISRKHWQEMKEKGYIPTYWKETLDRKWKKVE